MTEDAEVERVAKVIWESIFDEPFPNGGFVNYTLATDAAKAAIAALRPAGDEKPDIGALADKAKDDWMARLYVPAPFDLSRTIGPLLTAFGERMYALGSSSPRGWNEAIERAAEEAVALAMAEGESPVSTNAHRMATASRRPRSPAQGVTSVTLHDMYGEYAPWFDLSHPLNKIVSRRPSVDELEAILNSEEDTAIEILPNGEIRRLDSNEAHPKKPLTY